MLVFLIVVFVLYGLVALSQAYNLGWVNEASSERVVTATTLVVMTTIVLWAGHVLGRWYAEGECPGAEAWWFSVAVLVCSGLTTVGNVASARERRSAGWSAVLGFVVNVSVAFAAAVMVLG